MIPTANSTSPLDARLRALEIKLGISQERKLYTNDGEVVQGSQSERVEDEMDPKNGQLLETDFSRRLDNLQRLLNQHTTSEYRSLWQESWELMQDLNGAPGDKNGGNSGVVLTYQQQPLLYKRQEVLAAAKTLQQDFQHLHTLSALLQSNQKKTVQSSSNTKSGDTPANTTTVNKSAAGGGTSHASLLAESPILNTMNATISMDDQKRLETLQQTCQHIQARLQKVSTRFQAVLEAHHAIFTAASEKCILADEAISQKEVLKEQK